ncbi:MAG: hypothetical protein GXP00_12925 [Alphaproteobacteria bacterium]|nr:hypothetical protein [Emcibacter sp.]NOZ67372.1 hypothetical protein [Alphaproteobacteria bacterium]
MNEKIINELEFHQLPSGTIFKIGLICNLSIWGVFAIILGVLGAMGMNVVSWNDAYIHGYKAIIIALLICSVFAVIGSTILMLGGMIGNRIVRSPSLNKLSYITKTSDT